MLFLNESYGKELNKMMKGGKRTVEQIIQRIYVYGLRIPSGTLEVIRVAKGKEIDWEGIEKMVNSPLSRSEQDHIKREVFSHKETREKIKKEREEVKYIKSCPAKAWATLGGKKLREKMIERSLKEYIRSDEDEYIARTIGAFRSADLEEEVTLLDSLSFELEREDEAAHAAFDSSFESHWLWLNDGPITIVGKKEVRKAFVADCWSEYDEWSEELKETRGSNLSFSSIWEAKAVKESLVAAGVRWANNHSEIFASGKFEVEQVLLNPEKIKEEELQQLVLFLEDKKIQLSFYHWNKEIEREVRKELSFDWYESLVPANSKVALWD